MLMNNSAGISNELLRATTRRHFFQQTGFGIGAAALTSLLNPSLFAARCPVNPTESAGARSTPMFPAKAKSVIYLFMAGRAFAARPARSQADAAEIRWPECSRRS